MLYDVLIVGGGPAGLSAALMLGRARKRVLLCDAGPRRNAAAEHVHGFVTRDGVTPADFRRIGREQLEPYGNVEVRDVAIEEIIGERGAFQVRLTATQEQARRVLLCTGMVDELPGLDGFRALWGTSIFQCPYCHGWEAQDRRFAYLAAKVEMLDFALLLRGWSGDVVALTDGRYDVPAAARQRLDSAGVPIDERGITRLASNNGRLESVEFVEGAPLRREVLFMHPPQRQVDVVRALALALDSAGLVLVDEMTRETSTPGIYAAGDLVTSAQGALFAAASGSLAAARLNHALTADLATSGGLPQPRS
jgi:thioredoxin reductase